VNHSVAVHLNVNVNVREDDQASSRFCLQGIASEKEDEIENRR
jgi:hypothetical protein